MTEEQGWVIEHEDSDPGRPLYMTLEGGLLGWTHDHEKAFRMAREHDANGFARAFFNDRHRPGGHMWGDWGA